MHIDDRRLYPSYSVFVLQCSRPSHAGTVVPECFKDDNASQWIRDLENFASKRP